MTTTGSIPLDSPQPHSDAERSRELDAPPSITQAAVRQLALSAGFTEAGAVSLPHPQADRDASRFTEFVQSGRAGSMAYLARRNDENALIRSRVELPFPWAKSAVMCLAGYNADAPLSTAPASPGSGWIARYAWSGRKDATGAMRPSDYHKVLLKRLQALESAMRSAFGEFESRAYVDTGPVVERSLATAAGLGWTGKNTCLIHPKLGSWNFLAVIVTSLPLAQDQQPLTVPDRCGTCRRCLDACPTQALFEPYQMDATRCISYLTIEHRGEIAEPLLPGIGRQVFGCDICQDVCPWNRKSPLAVDESDQSSDLAPRRELINPDLEWLADLDLSGFERLFNGSPIRRAGFAGLRRNVAIAMGNSGMTHFLPRLQQWAKQETSPNPGIQPESKDAANSRSLGKAAQWAIARIRQNKRV